MRALTISTADECSLDSADNDGRVKVKHQRVILVVNLIVLVNRIESGDRVGVAADRAAQAGKSTSNGNLGEPFESKRLLRQSMSNDTV